MSGRVARSFNILEKNRWGDWYDHDPGTSPSPDAYIEKRNGKWTVSALKHVPSYIEKPTISMTCEQIKNLVEKRSSGGSNDFTVGK